MKYLCILLAMALAACEPASPPHLSETAPDDFEPNHAEIALVNFAHKKIGLENNYYNDKISNSDGNVKVCGEFTRQEGSHAAVRYSYSLDGVRTYTADDESAWQAACSNGWEPGTGR